MAMAAAPLYDDVAAGPADGQAFWARTSDGCRIRVGYWPAQKARGTLLLMPGRTEYVEKYGPTAAALAKRGISTVTVDWRGQGLADRLLDDHRVGHVGAFLDYQKDVAAMMDIARTVSASAPFVVLGHSMGGAIGLRAILDGLPVVGAVFTGPMWGIFFSPLLRPLAYTLPRVAHTLGMGTYLPPTVTLDSYPLTSPFENNMLTRDPEMYEFMRVQLERYPALQLGGPSLTWLHEATKECRALDRMASPDLPCVCYLGEAERIINRDAVRARMARWPRGEFFEVKASEHEVLMEVPATRNAIYDRIAGLFESPNATHHAQSA